ncbi:MAG: AI-2E family transporter [Endomicrobia bacterium]|nr:AI-2E family transporter [Endomicrobiia bacterium]
MLFLAGCLFLYFARGILAPFLIAAFITYLLSPLAVKIQSYGYRRWVSVVIMAAVFILIMTALVAVFIPILLDEIDKFGVNFPSYYEYVLNYAEAAKNKLETLIPILKEYRIYDAAAEKVYAFVTSEAQKVPQYLMSIFSMFSIIVLIPMLVFFMLLGGTRPIRTIVELVPSSYVETILSILYEMDSVLGRFIRGQLIEAVFVGTMSVIALSIFGVNFALIIGIVAGLANLIPYFGPFVGLMLASIVGLVQFQDIFILVKIIPSFLVIQFLDNNALQPLVVGQNLNLSPVTMIFAMLAGAQVFGFLGIIFAVPVMAIIKTIFFMLVKKYKKSLAYR